MVCSQVFNATACFTVPAGVTKLKTVEAWGAGGCATPGLCAVGCCPNFCGFGGGGGGYGKGTCIPVTPGQKYKATVGVGGSATSLTS